MTAIERRIVRRARKMFDCDTARIVTPFRRMFLIVGWTRSTRDDSGQWFRNGKPIDFTYIKEQVIASGTTEQRLLESMQKYKHASAAGCSLASAEKGQPA